MPIDTTPLTPTKLLTNFALKNQTALQDVSIAIASGQKHQDYAGYAQDGTLEQLLNLDASLSHLASFTTSINVATTRATSTRDSIDKITTVASNFIQSVTQALNGASGSVIPIQSIGTEALNEIATALNIQFDGRYLFAGSKINTEPVQNIQNSNINYDSEATNSGYYHGDTDIAGVRVNEDQNVSYGVLASNPAFQEVVGAIHLAMQAFGQGDTTKLGHAEDQLTASINDLASLRGGVSLTIQSLNDASQTVSDATNSLSNSKTTIANTDIVNATTDMSWRQANLQALYLALDRITKLSVVYYMN
jgi:flagellar hook-associated protein 3 FlgL